MLNLRQLIDFYVLGRHRLETVKMLPLGCAISDAISLYGDPHESKPSEESSEIIRHVFFAGPYHDVVVFEWKQKVQSITYCSEKSDPARDLDCMLDRYKEGSHWQVMEEGYWYYREDQKVKLGCSAMPIINVAYTDFLEAQAEYKMARAMRQLQELDDVTWAPNGVIWELQREFIENQDTRLKDFASQSDRIAVSPDGHNVFIVRNHHAFDSENGFREMNCPPESDNDYSTQVINLFTWGEGGQTWSKAVLPRNANVDIIRYIGDQGHLQIRQVTTDRVLTFNGPGKSIFEFIAQGFSFEAYDDEELWKLLEEAELSSEADGVPPDTQS